MKIAYVAHWDVSRPSGVYFKMLETVKLWRSMGHDARLFVSSSRPKFSQIDEVETVFAAFPKSNGTASSLQNYFSKIINHFKLANALRDFQPDITYIRLSIWYPGMTSLLKLGTKSVLEINSRDLNEIHTESKFKQLIYRFGRPKIIETVDGYVTVTNELATDFLATEKPVLVYGNGASFETPIETREKQTRAQAIFVGSDNQFWHGVDKIVQLAELAPEIDFHVVGCHLDQPKSATNLFVHGEVFGEELESLYKNADVGIGTLALHRKGMDEACPLKVRSYATRGLPIIIAYQDTDLSDTTDFCLRLPNTEDNVITSVEKIKHFVQNWHGKDHNSDRYRSHLDYMIKEPRRLAFFKSI